VNYYRINGICACIDKDSIFLYYEINPLLNDVGFCYVRNQRYF